MFNYVRSRQLEGTYPGDPTTGTWVNTGLRIAKGWGSPTEEEWPYDGDAAHWPPVEPPNIDELAKPRRITAYQRARSVTDCRTLLASELPVTIALQIDDSWFTAPGGVIQMPGSATLPHAHTTLLVGYEDQAKRFIIQNSWGVEWGDSGHGYLPYRYLETYLLEAWCLTQGPIEVAATETTGMPGRRWGIADPLGGTLHGTEIVDAATNDMIGWSLAVERVDTLEMEELFVRPAWRGQGYGRRLAKEMRALAARLERDLQAWVPHSDAPAGLGTASARTLAGVGLGVRPSPVPWAAAVAVPAAA